jgi:hypothetical protein
VVFSLPHALITETFNHFRTCGRGACECQVLWTSSWDSPQQLDGVVHPVHRSHGGGFQVDRNWLHVFSVGLLRANRGVQIQVHTHPGEAFHSATDDRYPIIHMAGFMSLVIPDFGLGKPGFERAYLAEMQQDGSWTEVAIEDRIKLE